MHKAPLCESGTGPVEPGNRFLEKQTENQVSCSEKLMAFIYAGRK
ncbi:hypothetical protein X474_07375 [Dethiosulfatarculus sandiegensis]|uniref:Uncharacterized protein n=1 Tax=Dethiosulfatarculus sandiegensis TaxID=1429043 RepID=A0A0D2JG50_9BACT|nr:hypothetical protein X474_07375 [Dethiosulfatarculus sandiegensis]